MSVRGGDEPVSVHGIFSHAVLSGSQAVKSIAVTIRDLLWLLVVIIGARYVWNFLDSQAFYYREARRRAWAKTKILMRVLDDPGKAWRVRGLRRRWLIVSSTIIVLMPIALILALKIEVDWQVMAVFGGVAIASLGVATITAVICDVCGNPRLHNALVRWLSAYPWGDTIRGLALVVAICGIPYAIASNASLLNSELLAIVVLLPFVFAGIGFKSLKWFVGELKTVTVEVASKILGFDWKTFAKGVTLTFTICGSAAIILLLISSAHVKTVEAVAKNGVLWIALISVAILLSVLMTLYLEVLPKVTSELFASLIAATKPAVNRFCNVLKSFVKSVDWKTLAKGMTLTFVICGSSGIILLLISNPHNETIEAVAKNGVLWTALVTGALLLAFLTTLYLETLPKIARDLSAELRTASKPVVDRVRDVLERVSSPFGEFSNSNIFSRAVVLITMLGLVVAMGYLLVISHQNIPWSMSRAWGIAALVSVGLCLVMMLLTTGLQWIADWIELRWLNVKKVSKKRYTFSVVTSVLFGFSFVGVSIFNFSPLRPLVSIGVNGERGILPPKSKEQEVIEVPVFVSPDADLPNLPISWQPVFQKYYVWSPDNAVFAKGEDGSEMTVDDLFDTNVDLCEASILVAIGMASSAGPENLNDKISRQRSQATGRALERMTLGCGTPIFATALGETVLGIDSKQARTVHALAIFGGGPNLGEEDIKAALLAYLEQFYPDAVLPDDVVSSLCAFNPNLDENASTASTPVCTETW